MLDTVEHSYACKIFRQNKIRIFRDGKEILDQLYPLEYKPLKTYMTMGYNYSKEFLGKEGIKKSTDYCYLNSLGWKIISRYASSEFMDYQRVAYCLVQIDSIKEDYGRMPKDHNFEVDFINHLIRFNGANVSHSGTTGWMPLNPRKDRLEKETINPFQIDKIHSLAENNFEDNLPEDLRTQEEDELKPISDAVVGITENGEFCCMEKTDESPRISISGEAGMGKTMLMNNLEGQFHYKFGWIIMNINDVKGDTQTRCLPWDKNKDKTFLRELARFKEPTIPMPYIYLHPTIKGIKDEDVFYKDEVGFEISFPLKKFLFDQNLMAYNTNWEINQKAKKFVRRLIEDENGNERTDGLLHKKTTAEIRKLIDDTFPKKMESMNDSVYHLIMDIWNRGILDITTGINSKWIALINGVKYEYPPWDICLLCGISPSIITEHIRTQDWFAMWLKYILEDVFWFSSTKVYMTIQGKNIMLSGDEMADILRTDATKLVIDKTIREGRTKYVGFMQSTQHFKDIPDSIITNLTHYFVFNTQSPTDFKIIKSKFDLNPTQTREIKHLNKFQCYAFGEFILYDSNGNRYSNDGRPVKIIKIKPPNANNYGGYKKLKEKEGKK